MKKDKLTIKAKKEGYFARSVYKLKEINKRFNLIKKNSRVLDLGCSPGSWSQTCLEIIDEDGEVVGVDLVPCRKIKNKNFRFVHADASKEDIMEGEVFDVVISDMAPKTIGITNIDHENSIDLCRNALNIAKKRLKKNGNFLCKIFEGALFNELLKEIRKNFHNVKVFKPQSSKKRSKEIYIIAKGLKRI